MKAARDRIREDLDGCFCVEAGAGTGKTTVLVDRVVALLASGAATIDELAVITFTEKAAGELSVRVRFELERAREGADPTRGARIDAALTGLYRARIQTIHAFAAGVLRERPIEARLDPGFETLDELGAGVLFDDAYAAWLDDLLGSERPDVAGALEAGFRLRNLRELCARADGARAALPLAAHDPPDAGALRERAAELAGRLTALADGCTDAGDGLYPQARDAAARLAAAAATTGDEALAAAVSGDLEVVLNAGSAAAWGGDCEDIKDALRTARDEVWVALRALPRVRALLALLPHASRFAVGLAERRRTEGGVDFDDLIVRARDLVRDDVAVRRFLHARTRRILVDEFQDTDAAQAELLVRIAAPPGDQGADWRALRPAPGALLVVGDPKQSIYRFRGADLAVYQDVKRGPLAGDVVHLVRNFRSTPGVLAFANRVFGRVLVEQPGVQAAHVDLEPDRAPVADGPSVTVPRLRGGDEAHVLALTVRRCVDEAWPVLDPRTRRVRPAQWRDLAILLPARGQVEQLEAALARHGVPARNESGRGFYARPEIHELIALLQAIDDPADAIAVVGALRSPAFGVTDDDLVRHRLAGGSFRLHAPVPEESPLDAALAELADLHRARRGLSLGELVRLALERTALVETLLSLPDGDQMAANVLKLLDEARAFSAAGGGTLRGFSAWLARRQEGEDDDAPDAPVAEETDDCVRVMTVHAAKGLEFPIVALGNVSRRRRGAGQAVADAERRLLHTSFGSTSDRFATPGWLDVAAAERSASDAEGDRLLYVAVTRARDHLIVPDVAAGNDHGFLARLRADIHEPDDLVAVVEVPSGGSTATIAVDPPLDPAVVDAAVAAHAAWATERERVVRDAARGVTLATATGVVADPRPLAAIVSGLGADAALSGLDLSSAPPLDLGEALHRTMELVSLPGAEDLEAVAAVACAEAGIPALAPAVTAMARACLGADALTRALAAPGGARREVPFTAATPDGAAVASGRIDLLFRDGDGIVVVDWKTDDVPAGAIADRVAHHRGQAAVYAWAAERATRLPVREVVLVFCRAGTAASIAVDDGLRAEGEALVRRGVSLR